MSLNCKHLSDGVSTWAKFDDHIYLLYKNLPFIMYYGVQCFCLHVKYIVYKHLNTECTLGHQSLGVCEVSYTYLLGCLRY